MISCASCAVLVGLCASASKADTMLGNSVIRGLYYLTCSSLVELDMLCAGSTCSSLIELDMLCAGVSEIDTSPHVLLECVDFYMMRKNDVDPQQHLSALIQSKTGEEPVYMWLFEQQEAIAVTMSSTEKALLL